MSNDTLIREVDDELRRDRMRKLWRQAAPFVIGAAIAVVLLVAGYEGWTWYQDSTSAKSSAAPIQLARQRATPSCGRAEP